MLKVTTMSLASTKANRPTNGKLTESCIPDLVYSVYRRLGSYMFCDADRCPALKESSSRIESIDVSISEH